MKKILYYSVCSYAAPQIGVVIDDILTSKKNGNDVYWLYCKNALSACLRNVDEYSSKCKFCGIMYEQYIKKYGNGVNIIPVKCSDYKHKDHSFTIKNSEDLRALEYRGVQIGMSILSIYFTRTRDLDVQSIDQLLIFSKPLISQLCDFIDYAYDIIDKIQPDEIRIFNGRLFENRLFYDIACVRGIFFTSLEIALGSKPYKKISFKGGLPHDYKLRGKMIMDLWKKTPENQAEKEKIASSFFTKRRSGDLVADVKVYTKEQKEGELPKGFNNNKKNIAIFNSSQDEFAALGGMWKEGLVFQTQFEAIEYLVNNSPSQIHYYLRIHPNLKGINHKEHTDLYIFNKFDNITVIPPESEVSSYALLDACDKAITFGSSMGVEATYWGKPSIQIGHSYYELIDAAYIVHSKEELIDLVSKDLPAKNKENALKYSYFMLDRTYGVDKNIIDIDVHYKSFRWKFECTSYFKIWGAQILYQIVYYWYCIIMPKFHKKNVFPKRKFK